MSRRTVPDLVKGVLMSDYGPKSDGTYPSLHPFIHAANAVTTQVAACALTKGITLSDDTLELIERWMAAHYYTRSDRTYKSRSTEGASGAFNADGTEYSSVAVDLDYSGCLNAILKRQRAGSQWLGKPPSEQIPYNERD